MSPAGRAVVLVGNPAAPYSRGLRIARVLAAEGYAVEIAAVSGEGLPDRETDGEIVIRRYRPGGPLAAMAATYKSQAVGGPIVRAQSRWKSRTIRESAAFARKVVAFGRKGAAASRRWLFWPHTVRAWWHTLERELEPADLYHACGSLTIAAALAARARDRRSGRQSRVIYDAIDDVAASNNLIGVPWPIRRLVRNRERRWALAADARVTVNDELAARLRSRWNTPQAPVVVPNWPEPPSAAAAPSNLIREHLGLPAETRIVLFQGRLGPYLGLDEAAEAVLIVPGAALVLMGFGRWFDRSRARDADPRFQGRHFTLPAVHPDALVAWTGSADVALVPLPPVSDNQRASTPNKFWEAASAGTPVVVGPGLTAMADLIERYDLGVVARSLEPADLAAAIEQVLTAGPDETAARRARIAAVAREHFSWPVAAERYRKVLAAGR